MAKRSQRPQRRGTRKQRVSSVSDPAIEHLCSLQEVELSETYIKPLLRELGYDKVDDHGGPSELGRDFICWKSNAFGRSESAVVQVKKYLPTGSPWTPAGLPSIISQLEQAIDEPVLHTDGTARKPLQGYFITPYCIDTRALESRFERISALSAGRVQVIDGVELVQLLRQKLPHLLLPKGATLQDLRLLLSQSNDNEPLLRALHSRRSIDRESLYTDLAFVVSRRSAALLLEPVKAHDADIDVSYDDLKILRDLNEVCVATLDTSFLRSSHDGIEASLTAADASRTKAIALERTLSRAVNVARQPLEVFLEKLQSTQFQAKNLINATQAELGRIAEDLKKAQKTERKTREVLKEGVGTVGDVLESERTVRALKQKQTDLQGSPLMRVESLVWRLLLLVDNALREAVTPSDFRIQAGDILRTSGPAVDYIDTHIPITKGESLGDEVHAFYKSLTTYHDALAEKRAAPPIPEITITIQIDTASTSVAITELRKRLASRVARINGNHDAQLLAELIRDIHRYTVALEPLLTNRHIRSALCDDLPGSRVARPGARPDDDFRLTVPVRDLFSTGESIVVVGDAGAGKTTTLQGFARHDFGDGRERLFFPLGQAAKAWEAASGNRDSLPPDLVSLLGVYIRALGSHSSDDDLRSVLASNRMTLVLDAVDEAAAFATNMGALLMRFAQEYTGVQVVVSSRDIDEYIEAMPFAAVKLLEFTPQQRNAFIERWFAEASPIASRVLSHIRANASFAETIRNPLQATVLCVLAESDLTLPESEWKLYEARVRLLTGRYDTVKGIPQRTQTRSEDLERIAKGIAFRLHLSQGREGTREQFVSMACEHFPSSLSRDACRQAVNELVCPCNILVPMTEGNVGFGHLRYQEFLAAWKVRENRTTDLSRILCSPWWSGVCVLLAGMDFDFEWLEEYVARENLERSASRNLAAMWKHRGLTLPIAFDPRVASREVRELQERGTDIGDEME